MRPVLVTGGAGFIGSHLAAALVATGRPVVVVDDLSGGIEAQVPVGARFVRASVTDSAAMEALFAEGRFERVYHLAAYAAEGLSHFIRRFNYENNLLGSVNLLNAALRHDCAHFVFTSSIAAYGAGHNPMRESDPCEPEDPYGVAKLAVEHDLRAASRMFGIRHTIFRPHNVYGPHQNIGDRYRNVVGIFMNQTLRGEPLTVFGSGDQSRAFSYIDDIVGPIVTAPDVPGATDQTFNIGGALPTTVLALAQAVRRVTGVESPIRHLDRRDEVVHAFASHDKLRGVFGARPDTALLDGLAQMWAWAAARGPMEPSRFGNIEVERGLPPSWRV